MGVIFQPGASCRRVHCRFVLLTLALPAALRADIDWVTFEDQTSIRLQADAGVGTADAEEKDYATGDVDNDGDIDLVCVRKQPFTTPGGRSNVLFMNEGIADGQAIDGVLVDRTSIYIPQFADQTNDRDVVLADVNGDGWLDLVTSPVLGDGLTKEMSHPRIYMNQGADEFGGWLGFVFDTPNTRIPDFSIAPRFCGVVAGDVDNDGDVDLYFVDYDQGEPARPEGVDLDDRLLINDGTGYFTDESEARLTAPMRDSRFGLNAQIVDLNSDGWLDIIKDTALVNPKEINVAYNNLTGAGTAGFFDTHANLYNLSPYHVGVGDLNNDALPDLVVSDHADDRYLLNLGNDPNGQADFISYTFDFLDNYTFDDTFAGENVLADLDRDGFLDVIITDVDANFVGCTRRMHFYRNLGNAPDVVLQDQGTLGIDPAMLVGAHDVAFFDINGDEWLDMVLGRCDGMQVYLNLPPTGIGLHFPQGIPAFVDPDVSNVFQVEVVSFNKEVQPAPGSATMSLSIDDGAFLPVDLLPLSDNLYEATLPAGPCLTRYAFFFSAETLTGETVYSPPGAPTNTYISQAATASTIVVQDEMEDDVSSWLVVSEPGTTGGAWQHATPIPTIFSAQLAAPAEDATSGEEDTMAFVTQNGVEGGSASASDVDGGPTRLISPVIDLADSDGKIGFSRWVYCNDTGAPDGDYLTVDVSNDDGGSWVAVPELSSGDSHQIWEPASFIVSDYIAPTGVVRVRFSIADALNNSITEAGIDSFSVEKVYCEPGPPVYCMGDVNLDGIVDPLDYGFVLARLGCDVNGSDPLCAQSDANQDGLVDPLDAGFVSARFGTCVQVP